VDTKKLLENLSLTKYPVALGGCRNDEKSFDCCEYDITIFDETNQNDSVTEYENELIRIHHGSLHETRFDILTQYTRMKVLWDEKWDLKIFLSQVLEKKEKIFKAYAKSCLVEAAVCALKAKEGLKNSDPFASSWLKCSAYYIADAIILSNNRRPSPAHMLEYIRDLEKNSTNEKFVKVNETIGMERATQSQLLRMCKSTMGFSDMVENNGHSKIIQKKHDYLVKNSLLSDCYFYLGYINRNNFIKIKDTLPRKPELIHVLKIAFDVESDIGKLDQQADTLHRTSNELLLLLSD
jgi:hypothetical protein